jgi:hypothetical protein
MFTCNNKESCETGKRLVCNLENIESNQILKISPLDKDEKMKNAVGKRLKYYQGY